MTQEVLTVAVCERPDWGSPEAAGTLAQRLGLTLVPDEYQISDYCRFIIFFQQGRLSLQQTAARAPGAICVDFDDSALTYRRNHPVQPEALLKASGVKQGGMCRVLDATAGLGQDAFIFASAGCQVILMERSLVLHALLADGLRRAAESENDRVAESSGRMTLIHGDSASLSIKDIDERPEVVYLDPMFPDRRKSAKVKKNMFLLQQLLETDIPSADLLGNALHIASRRVVVKRPRHADFLEGRRPSHQLVGKASRFDVYLPITPSSI
ncbi:MAG: class I SAM-dependent methyltransferase [Gammaproteobacteria bacterium]|nr:class I SAM-dependent methyltransferase [Gammaproteobacteria bacterium]MDP2140943.1 class I SAM-dependent methyltransferase [Gammaproteobacteria bacterium]MDP2349313.1 class I SAM-dependent methyltransferase [Gammaproteobacteria bacterium]